MSSAGVTEARLGELTVRRVGFGAMQLPGPGVFGPPRDHDEAIAVLRRAVELGVNHIDTAQFYGPAVANELIRAATPRGVKRFGSSDNSLVTIVMSR